MRFLELISVIIYLQSIRKTPEGVLTKKTCKYGMRADLCIGVQEKFHWEIIYYLESEDATGGRKRDSIVSDAVEALIGAIYLDGGFANAKEFIDRFILKRY